MSKTTLVLAAKITVTGLLLYIVLRHVAIDEVIARLAELSPGALLLSAALIGLQTVVLAAWRWERVVAAIDRAVKPWRLTGMVVISLFFNQVLPSTVGGDGMRMWLLHRTGRPLGVAVRSVIIDRILGLLGLLLLSLGSALVLALVRPEGELLWAVAAVSAAGIAAIAGAPFMLPLFASLPLESLRRQLETIATEVAALQREKILLVRLIAVSMLGHVIFSLAIWCTGRGIGVSFPLLESLAVLPAVILAASLPVSIAGWGVRESGMVVGLGLLGVTTSDAVLVSVFFGLLLLSFGMAGGLIWLVQRSPKPVANESLDLSSPLAVSKSWSNTKLK